MTNYRELRNKLLSDPEVMKEYNSLSEEFEIAEALIKARMKANLTQADVAKRMHTSQAQIARMESGEHMPSLHSIYKYAKAVKQEINITILP